MDLFPHTKHCELVILFERVKPEDEEAGTREESRSGTGSEMPISTNPDDESPVPVAEEQESSSDRKVVGDGISGQCFGSSSESGPNSGTEKSMDAQNSSGGKVPENEK